MITPRRSSAEHRRRPAPGAVGLTAIALFLGLGTAVEGRAAARLDLRAPSGARHMESVFQEVLRAPGDSVALSRSLVRVTARLEDEGYLDARLEARWDPVVEGRDPRLVVTVDPGAQVRIGTLDIQAAGAEESAALRAVLGIAAGDPASPRALSAALTRATAALAQQGYPYAELAIQSFEWDSAGARVRISGARGPQVTVSGVRFEGLRATRPEVVRRVTARAEGRPFQPAAAEAARIRLLQLGLFRAVHYKGLEGEPDWQRARLVYQVEEPRYNRFEGAVGRQSDGHATGVAGLQLGNLAGTGRVVAGRWESRGRDREAFEARYVEPWLGGLPLRADLRLDHTREDTLFTRERAGVRLHFLLTGGRRVEAGYEQERVLQPYAAAREATLQSTVFAIEHDGRDFGVAPARGERLRLAGSTTFKREVMAAGVRRSSRTSAVEGGLDWHRPLAGRLGLAWDVSGAARFSTQPTLALYERYTIGGAATLRGYDEQAFRADRYGLSRLEGRWFVGRGPQHLALFWDHAWMWSRIEDGNLLRVDEKRRNGVGFGMRFDSPAGRIGVDYGLEPGRPPAEGKLHLQLISSF